MSTSPTGLEVRLASRPDGLPTVGNFEIAQAVLPEVGPGQAVVRNLFLSLDAAMLMLIQDQPGLPMPAYQVGSVMYGAAVGEVVQSEDPSLQEGDLVVHRFGWREYAVAPAAQFRPVDRDDYDSPAAYLDSGLVAYVGLQLAGLREGDTVYVSSAAGAVGTMAGQIARLLGAGLVVGSTGSAAKADQLVSKLGYDAAFDYHDGQIADQLRETAPDGVDLYFDNVGGRHLEAAMEVMNPHGRIALCGALERQFTGEAGPGLAPLTLTAKRLTVRGYVAAEHPDHVPTYRQLYRDWLRDGSIVVERTVIDGLPNAPQAFVDLLSGTRIGKTVIQVSP